MLLWCIMIKKSLQTTIILGLFFIGFIILFNILLPKSNSQLQKKDFIAKQVKTVHYVAIGDSLTEGIGDTTNQGGFVSILANDLHTNYGYQVEVDNYGVAGNTSSQILKRMTNESAIEESLKTADLMTLTVGGNDVLAVIRKNLSHLTLEDFQQASRTYQERLGNILDKARQDNPELPIYVLGIYNPFYLSFPGMTEMQEVIDQWNLQTQEVIADYTAVYFVPINEVIYKGIADEYVDETITTEVGVNNALFEEDRFHPNTIGYRLMANAVGEVIHDTKEAWFKD